MGDINIFFKDGIHELTFGTTNYRQVDFRSEIVTLSLSKGAYGEFLRAGPSTKLRAGFDRLSLTESRTEIDRIVAVNPYL